MTNTLNIEGRLNDGWAYALQLKSGETIRVCDTREPNALWTSIAHSKTTEKPGVEDVIVFSGAREVPNGKVDGMAFISASEIVAPRNWGPSVMGLSGERLAKLEDIVAKHEDALMEHKALIEELDEAVGDDEDEGQEGPEGATITPIPGVETVPVEAAEALASAADDEDEG